MRAHRLSFMFSALLLAIGCGNAPPEAAAPTPPPPAPPPATTTSAPAAAARPAYPPTPKRPQTVTVSGVSFQDDYAWLRNAEDPEVARWIEAQNELTNRIIGDYPGLEDLSARIRGFASGVKPVLYDFRSSRRALFARKRAPQSPQPAIVTVGSLDKPEDARVVLDPAAIDPSGQTSIDWYVVSADGKRIAASLSKGGSEDGLLSIFDAETGKRIDGPLERVQYGTAGGSAAFTNDGKSMFYTRYPAPGERPEADIHRYQQLYRHTVGGPVSGDQRVAIELPDIAEIDLDSSARDGTILARVKVGDGGDLLWFIGRPSAKGITWSRFADAPDAVAAVKASGDSLYVLSRKGDLRGAVLRVPLGSAKLADAKVVVPASDRELTDLSTGGGALLSFDVLRGVSRVRAFDLSGKPRGEVTVPARSYVVPVQAADAGGQYLSVESFTTPLAIYRLDVRTLALKKTPIFEESPARFDDLEIVDETAVSRDGTKVPITMLIPRGVSHSPDTPLLLHGYGGYGIGMEPWFDARRRAWFDQGAIYAFVHTRGGDDYGEAWHLAGKLGNKQNVFDDFIAGAERVVAAGYTSKAKLALTGRSNGGLLMSAVLTQRPDLARAVVDAVPFLDMVRFETWPNGTYNRTEFGSITDPELRPKLLAYSPYQNAKSAAYPAVLLISGLNDARVDPADARTFAAKLQGLSTSDFPVLLRTWADSGHGIGTNIFKQGDEEAQTYAFLLRELGVTYHKVTAH